MKLQSFDTSYFKKYKKNFQNDGTQKCLVFQPMKYFDKPNQISEWKPKGFSDEITKPTSSLAPALSYFGNKTLVKLDRGCLKKNIITFNHGKLVYTYIVYELRSNLNNFEFTLKNLFGVVKLTKNNDIDMYKCSGYGIGFDSCGTFLFSSGKFAQNVINVGVDMSSFVHADNKNKDILILVECATQELHGTTLTAEKKYSINFTVCIRKFCLSLHAL